MAGPETLPEFVAPMLARSGEPFDSADHLYEIKWDGIRCLLFVERDGVRLRNRKGRDVARTYPELATLAGLEPGAIVDGEIVALEEGLPSFHAVLAREQARNPRRIAHLAATAPVTFVAFDLLYRRFGPVLDEPLLARRDALVEATARADPARLVVSDGVIGGGLAFFDEVRARGLEGCIAKHVTSPYLPGRRTDHWIKMKPFHTLLCAIIGFVPEEGAARGAIHDLKSVIVAAPRAEDGALESLGRVGSGLSDEVRRRLLPLLLARRRAGPLVPSREKGVWVEPGLYCVISYAERTRGGSLRAPVFRELVPGTDPR